MYELPHELANDLGLRILGNQEISRNAWNLWNAWIDSEYTAVNLKAKFWRFSVKYRKKIAVKHSIEKSILFNFANLSPTFCPRL